MRRLQRPQQHNPPPGRSGARLWGTPGKRKKTSPYPGMAAAIKEGTRPKTTARQMQDRTDKDLTNSERQCGRMQGKWISTHGKPVRLETHHRPTRPGTSRRELPSANDGGDGSAPTRRAEEPPRPTTTAAHGLRVHGSARHDLRLLAWTPCAGCTQHSGATPTGNTTFLPAAWSTSSERSRRTDTPLNPNGLAPKPWTAAS
jgi:hypothetical protein